MESFIRLNGDRQEQIWMSPYDKANWQTYFSYSDSIELHFINVRVEMNTHDLK